MPHEVIMPALGMAQDTGLIVSWHKAPGDAVAKGDVLFEVETDKATMEVEAQADGYLNGVRAKAGEDVPVGQVIALIGDSADEVASEDVAATERDTHEEAKAPLPEGKAVIMPALGMAQDSGVVVAWHKAPGDAVTALDVLFEVETDKSTVEVEAGHDGYVAALLLEAGEEAPVGETIALISKEKPTAPLQRSRRAAGSGTAPAKTAPAAPAPQPARAAPSNNAPAAAPSRTDGRILASPKARRIALEQGLDLNRLVAAGHPQPYHVADLEVLRGLPEQTPDAPAAFARRLTATLPEEGLSAFADWAADAAGLTDPCAVIAGLAAASLGTDMATVSVESPGRTRTYTVPPGPLTAVTQTTTEAAPDIIVRDLRFSRVSSVTLGAEDRPVLTLTADGTGLAITLECAGDRLSAPQAIDLLSGFAGRIEQPLRHLL